jgi:small subunit ribosomal protein S6
MRNYELVTVISPTEEDESVTGLIDQVSKLVEERGGSVGDVDRWGKRKLAYPIKEFSEGNYILARFESGAGLIKEINAMLEASSMVLRHLVIKVDG